MNRVAGPPRVGGPCPPRACGDEPPLRIGVVVASFVVRPAHAGMNRLRFAIAIALEGPPRACGDITERRTLCPPTSPKSPHQNPSPATSTAPTKSSPPPSAHPTSPLQAASQPASCIESSGVGTRNPGSISNTTRSDTSRGRLRHRRNKTPGSTAGPPRQRNWVRYKITANPVHAPNRVRRPITDPDRILAWWHRTADRIGLVLDSTALLDTAKTSGMRRDQRVVVQTATMEGVATIRDVDTVRDAIVLGVGHARAYGCGLLSVVPLE